VAAYTPDDLDLKIISALRRNGRQSNSEVARKLGVTEATIRARIQRLTAEGIMQIVALTNPTRIGYEVDVLVSIEVTPGKLFDVAEELGDFEEVRYLAITTGRYDLQMSALFRDKNELFHFLTERLARVPGVQKYETFHVLRTVKRTYDYWKTPLNDN
jgi:Lrp/AsnC family transcriptional regulator for asnA, asnC and gidA